MTQSPKRWSALRARGRAAPPNAKERAALALQAIAAGAHGEALFEYLAQEVVSPFPGTEDGAWQRHEARRQFAAELLEMMESKQHDGTRAGTGRR